MASANVVVVRFGEEVIREVVVGCEFLHRLFLSLKATKAAAARMRKVETRPKVTPNSCEVDERASEDVSGMRRKIREDLVSEFWPSYVTGNMREKDMVLMQLHMGKFPSRLGISRPFPVSGETFKACFK